MQTLKFGKPLKWIADYKGHVHHPVESDRSRTEDFHSAGRSGVGLACLAVACAVSAVRGCLLLFGVCCRAVMDSDRSVHTCPVITKRPCHAAAPPVLAKK